MSTTIDTQSGERLSFYTLFSRKKYRILIPIIQRDFAQGRKNAKEVRDTFLDALYKYLDENRPTFNSGDVAYASAMKILGIENECFGNLDIPSFVHMKGLIQNINEAYITEDWTKHIPTYFKDDGSFKIGNFEQTLPFHYQVKEWLTDDMISILEKRVGI